MRSGHRTRLFRVIDEVALRVIGRFTADDLDGVFIGAHSAVGAEAVEEGEHGPGILGGEFRIVVEARVADVVVDANGEGDS